MMSQDGALIVLDGVKMGTDPSILSEINPRDVEDIQILLNPIEMSRYTSLNSVGVIEIKTMQAIGNKNPFETNKMGKTTGLKVFKPESIGNDKFNLKTTLQWIPILGTDENGEATIPFKAGSIQSTFVFEIAGFTDQGQWISNQSEITVK